MLETTSQHIPTIQNVSVLLCHGAHGGTVVHVCDQVKNWQGDILDQVTAIRSISRMVRLKKVLKIAKILERQRGKD